MKKAQRLVILTLALLTFAFPIVAQSEKIALVDTNAFIQPQTGITRLVRAMESVEQEFAPRLTEIAALYARLHKEVEKYSYAGPIPTDPRPVTPERRKALKDTTDTLQRTIEERQASLQTDYGVRLKETTAPISQDIRRQLELFAKARGITLLLDASKLACVVGCERKAAATLDITQEFIAAYNRLNP